MIVILLLPGEEQFYLSYWLCLLRASITHTTIFDWLAFVTAKFVFNYSAIGLGFGNSTIITVFIKI